jgi:5'-nucleotidase
MVIAGINEGANLGDDVLYSGTGRRGDGRTLLRAPGRSRCRSPELHVRRTSPRRRASRVCCSIACSARAPADTILNVNVPDLPYEQLAGSCATRLGHRHRAEPVVPAQDPRGSAHLLGRAGRPGAGCGTRHGLFTPIGRGMVSVTPAAHRSHAHRRSRSSRAGSMRRTAGHAMSVRGIGMTSARTRERLIERLRTRASPT